MKKQPATKAKRKPKESKPAKQQTPPSITNSEGKSRWEEFLEKHSKVGKNNPHSN